MVNAYLTGSPYTLTFGNEIMTQKILVLPMALILAFVLTGCTSSGGEMLPDTAPKQSSSYIVGPGDQLEIFVWRNPELSKQVTVRPDGKISSPLITELDVSGLEAPVIAGLIEAELSKYIRTPRVSVIVTTFNSTVDQQIRVIGSAGNPQVLSYRSGMTLLDVMIAVQGLAEFADGDNAKLIRKENGVDKSYSIKLDSLINDGDITMNRTVLPGDTIIIPEATF
ncbi:polysaccharide export protein [Draconibacterium sp.]|nr:polysaccharide export protein [Draconibacterium sp.]